MPTTFVDETAASELGKNIIPKRSEKTLQKRQYPDFVDDELKNIRKQKAKLEVEKLQMELSEDAKELASKKKRLEIRKLELEVLLLEKKLKVG